LPLPQLLLLLWLLLCCFRPLPRLLLLLLLLTRCSPTGITAPHSRHLLLLLLQR
jgi:hypothetical protein